MGTKLGKVLYKHANTTIDIIVNDSDMLVITSFDGQLLYLAELKYMRRN